MTILAPPYGHGVAWAARPPPRGRHPESETSLARAFSRSGSDRDFERIVVRYQDRVFHLVTSVLGPRLAAEAEDLTQDVFVHVYRKIHTFRMESRFGTWLYRVAYNLALERRQKARFRLPHVGEEALAAVPCAGEQFDPADSAATRQRRQIVLRCVEKLDEPHRTVIYLYYWMRCSVAEIAEQLGIPPGTVKSHLHRARARLASRLVPEGSDE